MGGAGCFGKFAARLLKFYIPYVAFAADRFVHPHIKDDTRLIKDFRIYDPIILQ